MKKSKIIFLMFLLVVCFWFSSPVLASASETVYSVTESQMQRLLAESNHRLTLYENNNLTLTDSAKRIAILLQQIENSQKLSQLQGELLAKSETIILDLQTTTTKLSEANKELSESFKTYKKQRDREVMVYRVVIGGAIVYALIKVMGG